MYMKSPRILLIGIGGVYNYGCEAIVRGTEAIVRQEYPDADIVYASRRVADDRKRLEGSEVQIIERGSPRRYSAKNIYRKLLSFAGIRWAPMVESLGLLENVDAVFSIGGDIYTLSPNGDYSMAFPKFGNAARKRGIPYVLWGASVGPFSDNPKAERAFTNHLKCLSLITARETATVDYLRSLGISDNVVSCADPAYVVAPEIKTNGIRQGGKFTIGINLSPLSIRYTGHSEEEAIHAQAKTIEGLIKAFDARIVLIPHVVSDFNEGDDDLRYLRKVKRAIASEHQDALSLLESDPGFVGAKKELVKCDLVIAARMHCAINALAAHVPTILVAYSRKAVGMCQYVYGNGDWVLPLSEFSKEGVLEEKVRAMKNQEPAVRAYLDKRIPEIRKDSYRPVQILKEVLGRV
jgi:polysaccharide pyruvyl transferase WcaK-like protein